MDIRRLKYFLAITAAGSFTTAAEELYISQSSLSKHIFALEEELGVQLFNRNKRQISLTEAGKIFLKHAKKFNLEYRTMMADLQEYNLANTTLAIVAIPVIAQYGISSCLAQFRSSYPDINLKVDERETSAILSALDNHEYDVAIVRDNYIDPHQYAFVEICSDKLMVIVSTRHALASRASISLAELANENFIMYDKGTLVYELTVNACRNAGFTPKINYGGLHSETIISLVALNFGITLMMGKIVAYYKQPDIVAIPLEQKIESKIVIAYLKSKKLSGSLKMFIDFMEREAKH